MVEEFRSKKSLQRLHIKTSSADVSSKAKFKKKSKGVT